MTNRRLIIDACCLINLDSSGQLLDIANLFSPSLAVCNIVLEEEITAINQIEGDTGQAVNSKIIENIVLDDAELYLFVEFAAHMGDDGESATFAVAVNRGWSVATDDKAAIKFLQKRAPEIEIISTLEIVKFWSEARKKTNQEVQELLLRIKEEGKYVPGKSHPLYGWWHGIMEEQPW